MIDEHVNELLLSCLRVRYDSQALRQTRQLANVNGLDWDAFFQHALAESVAPLVHHTLSNHPGILPPSVEQALGVAYYHAAARNALLFEELAGIVEILNEASVPVILLKGAALAQGVYENVAFRPMSDLDLLVPGTLIAHAEKCLVENEYVLLEVGHSFARHSTASAGTGWPPVELHRHIVSSPYYRKKIPEHWLWRDPVETSINGVPALRLSWTATVLHSCMHFLDHIAARSPLLWLCDISELLRREEADWDALCGAGSDFGVALPVTSVLETCSEALGLSLPEHFARTVQAMSPGLVERTAYQFCLSGTRSTASKTLFDFLTVEGLANKARLLSSRLFPSRDYMIRRYSIRRRWLVPLYYPRMLGAAAVQGIRALRRPYGQ